MIDRTLGEMWDGRFFEIVCKFVHKRYMVGKMCEWLYDNIGECVKEKNILRLEKERGKCYQKCKNKI